MSTAFDISVSIVGLEWKNSALDVTNRPKGISGWQVNLFHDAVLIGSSKKDAIDTKGPAVHFFSPRHPQWFKASGDGYSDDWMGCRGDLDKALAYYGLQENRAFPISNISELERCVRNMHREWQEQQVYASEALHGYLLEFIRLTARGHLAMQDSEKHRDEILSLRRRLREHCEEEWSIAEMAEEIGLSENRFAILYKQYCGASPQRDVIGFRMRRAVELVVEHRQLSIADIATICGYQDQLYFSRVFKRHFGRTPSSYRID